jgi:hypothetical protein
MFPEAGFLNNGFLGLCASLPRQVLGKFLAFGFFLKV